MYSRFLAIFGCRDYFHDKFNMRPYNFNIASINLYLNEQFKYRNLIKINCFGAVLRFLLLLDKIGHINVWTCWTGRKGLNV